MQDKILEMMKQNPAMNIEAVKENVEKAVAAAKEQADKIVPQTLKGIDETVAFNKANIDATVKAGTIAATGMIAMIEKVAGWQKAAIEAGLANAEKLSGVKDVQGAVELQSGLVREGYDVAVANATELGEMAKTVANDVSAPLQARVEAAVEIAKKPVAA